MTNPDFSQANKGLPPSKEPRAGVGAGETIHNLEIDRALSLLAQARPSPGLEQRIQRRLSETTRATVRRHALIPSFFRTKPVFASAPLLPGERRPRFSGFRILRSSGIAASVIAVMAAIGLLIFSTLHAPQTASAIPPAAARFVPHPGGTAPGVGTAAAIQTTPPSTKPLLHMHARGMSRSIHGRSRSAGPGISHHRHLPAGVAVPNSPVREIVPADPHP